MKTKKSKKTVKKPVRVLVKKPISRKKLTPRRKAKLAIKKARPIHRRFLLHPFTVFVLLCAGVFMARMTFNASADTVTVTAKVSAAALTQGATISQPLNGAIITAEPINVFGTCPTSSYVTLYRNETMSGVAICSGGNTYEIQTSLYPNANVLRVQAFNLTDDPGPTTPEITVIYNPPVITPPSTPDTTTATSTKPKPRTVRDTSNLPIITSDFKYNTFKVNDTFEWPIEIYGGTAPYKITSEWGDNNFTDLVANQAAPTTIKHKYKKAGYYKVKLKLVDANGAESLLQIVAIIKLPGSLISASSGIASTENSSLAASGLDLLLKHWVGVAWGSYAIVSVMAASFWLGERQQLLRIISQKSRNIQQHR